MARQQVWSWGWSVGGKDVDECVDLGAEVGVDAVGFGGRCSGFGCHCVEGFGVVRADFFGEGFFAAVFGEVVVVDDCESRGEGGEGYLEVGECVDGDVGVVEDVVLEVVEVDLIGGVVGVAGMRL